MRRFLFSSTVIIVLSAAASVFAQPPRPERPYRGLFESRVDDPEQLLTITSSGGGGYDTNVLFDQPSGQGVSDPRAAVGSSYLGFGARLNYSLNRSRIALGASATTSVRYYDDIENSILPAHSGSVGAVLKATKSLSVRAAQTISFQPFLSLGAVPTLFDADLGQVPPPGFELGVGSQEYTSYFTDLNITQNLSKRGSVEVYSSYQKSDYASSTAGFSLGTGDFTTRTVGGRFAYTIAQGLSARIGYGYLQAEYPGALPDFRGHTLDAGVDFTKALSLSRRTKLTFSTGSAANVYRDETHYQFLGNAHLTREIGRSWFAGVAYDRKLDLLPAFGQPVQSDSLKFGLGGLINRRLQFDSSIGVFIGAVGFASPANRYDTYWAQSGVTFGISRNLGLNAGYSYYRYKFQDNALPIRLIGLPQETDRHSVQASLVFWAPLYYRPRKPDATR